MIIPLGLAYAQSNTVLVRSNNEINFSKDVGHSERPQVSVSGSNVYVVWLDDTSGSRDVFFRKSTDGGSINDNRIIRLSRTVQGEEHLTQE